MTTLSFEPEITGQTEVELWASNQRHNLHLYLMILLSNWITQLHKP